MQGQYRTLSSVKLVAGNAPSPALGERAELCMLPLDRLVVDESYQRPITGKGRLNINRIVARFDWRKFAPLVVTEVDGGRYAIIDGQHRATAALMHPDVHLVPCMVVKANVAEAADTFAAINGATTSIATGQLFKSRVASGDEAALAVKAACDAAGVVLLAHRADSLAAYKRGETMAVSTVERCFKAYGRETLITALQCVTETSDGNPGCLRSPLIWALCEVLDERRDWRDAGERLLDAFDLVSFEDVIERGVREAARARVTQRGALKHLIERHLETHLRADSTRPAPKRATRHLEAAQ